jgi:hypothetical protein
VKQKLEKQRFFLRLKKISIREKQVFSGKRNACEKFIVFLKIQVDLYMNDIL